MSSDFASSNNTVGQVKWFNNKAGYGFITVKEADGSSKDIFCHYTNLQVDDSQYKYLVQGEYVEFVLAPLEDGKHEVQATQITGINGGQLMCQTRKLNTPSSTGPPIRRSTSRVQSLERRPTNDRSHIRRSTLQKEVSSTLEDAEGFTKVTKKAKHTTV
jgi:cold shock CspA family protein